MQCAKFYFFAELKIARRNASFQRVVNFPIAKIAVKGRTRNPLLKDEALFRSGA